MGYQSVFKRYEIKFLITLKQKERLLKVIEKYMKIDKYGKTKIRNIYYDTDDYRLIRNSIEKPKYKEKLRVRSYKEGSKDDEVFVEVKKKYKSVVYKRRLVLSFNETALWLNNGIKDFNETQISKEIDYFMLFYKDLKPKLYLSYDREAYYSLNGDDFRITFDTNINYRRNDFNFENNNNVSNLLKDDQVLMEVKTSTSIPLWLTQVLSEEHIYKTSFSKYGNVYIKEILPEVEGYINGNI